MQCFLKYMHMYCLRTCFRGMPLKAGFSMGGIIMQSILIKDTTREERIRIVNQSLQVCGQTCEFCNGCDNLGGGLVDSYFQPYIDGEKEISELNAAYHRGLVR